MEAMSADEGVAQQTTPEEDLKESDGAATEGAMGKEAPSEMVEDTNAVEQEEDEEDNNLAAVAVGAGVAAAAVGVGAAAALAGEDEKEVQEDDLPTSEEEVVADAGGEATADAQEDDPVIEQTKKEPVETTPAAWDDTTGTEMEAPDDTCRWG